MCCKLSSQKGKVGILSLMLILLLTLNFLLLSNQVYAGGDGEIPEKLAASNGSTNNIAISAYRLIVDTISDFFFYLRIELLE